MMLRLHTLGRATAVVAGRTIEPSAELLFAGLLVLGLESGRKFAREDFADLLWPDVEHTKRGARLRWLLNRFRSLELGFEGNATHISLPSKNFEADFLSVQEVELEAIGPVLPGYRPEFSAPLMRWVDDKREVVCAQVLRQLVPQLSAATHADDWTLATRVASAIQRIDSLNEEAALTLAEARCRLGGKAQALHGLEAYLDALGEDRPELQLPARVLQRRIKKADASGPMRSEPRFVGRTEQLSRIGALLTTTRAKSGGAMVVAGPAGIGKTRLLDEAVARTVLAGMQAVRVRCESADGARPLSGLVELIPQLLDLRGAIGANPTSYCRLSQFAQPGSETEPVGEQTSPEVLRSQLGTALLEVLDAASAELPVIIVIDDIQWADKSLSPFWEHLIRWSATHPVAVLFGFRTSAHDQPALSAPVMMLASLEASSAADLLDDLLTEVPRAMTAEERTALLARGAGSPLFLREIVRQWTLTGSADMLPTSLSGLFDVGLSGLSAPAMRALEVASILGSQATLERMERVMQLPRAMFIDAILELDTAGILSTDAKGNAYGHVLWADAALRRVSDSIARVLHRHAAEWFEAELATEPTPRLLWETARRWESAGRPEEARKAIVRGAEHLAQQGFPDEAANAYGHAAELATTPAEQLPLIRRRIDLLRSASRINDLAVEIERHEPLAAKLNPGYDRHNELEMLQIWVQHAQTGDLAGPMRRAVSCAREIRSTSAHRLRATKEAARIASLLDPATLIELLAIATQIQPKTRDERWDRDRVEYEYHIELGDPQMALAVAERMLADQREGGNRRYEAAALTFCGISHIVLGQLGDGRASMVESMRISRQYGFRDSLMSAYDELIGHSMDIDPPSVTRELIEEARQPLGTLEMHGGGGYMLNFPNHEAQLAVAEGRHAEALKLVTPLEEALACPVPRWRSHILGIHLAARMALGTEDRVDEIAASLEACFHRPTQWVDWPAMVFAAYLEENAGVHTAAEFASRFMRDVRRERFPAPQQLEELCKRAEDVLPLKPVVAKTPRRNNVALSG